MTCRGALRKRFLMKSHRRSVFGDDLSGLTLVPVYQNGQSHMEEEITLIAE